jgi:hypothetical protein
MDLTPAQVARTDQELAGFENAVHVLCDHWQTAIPDEPRAVRIGCLVHELAGAVARYGDDGPDTYPNPVGLYGLIIKPHT